MPLPPKTKKKLDQLVTRIELYEILLASSDMDYTERLCLEWRLAHYNEIFYAIQGISIVAAYEQKMTLT